MMRHVVWFFLNVVLWVSPLFAEVGGPQSLLQGADAVYRLSEEMVRHGMHGHTAEIIQQGKGLRESVVQLHDQVRASALPKTQKKAALASLGRALQSVDEAISHGEQKRQRKALDAARQTLFQMKQARQQIQSKP